MLGRLSSVLMLEHTHRARHVDPKANLSPCYTQARELYTGLYAAGTHPPTSARDRAPLGVRALPARATRRTCGRHTRRVSRYEYAPCMMTSSI